MKQGRRIEAAPLTEGIERIAKYPCSERTLVLGRPGWEYGFHASRRTLAELARKAIEPDFTLEKQVSLLSTLAEPVAVKLDTTEEADGEDIARAHVSILARYALQSCGVSHYAAVTPEDVAWVLAKQNDFCEEQGRFED